MAAGVVHRVIVLQTGVPHRDWPPQLVGALDNFLLLPRLLLTAGHVRPQAKRVHGRHHRTRGSHSELVTGAAERAVWRHELLGPVAGGMPVTILHRPEARP